MAQVFVSYNPYRMETKVEVNGNQISNDSSLFKIVKGKRLQEWVGKFPQMLVNELNTVDFEIEFYGMPLDWDDFEDAFLYAKKVGVIKKLNLKFIEGKSDEDINERIISVFKDLQEGPVEDFRDPKLARAFQNINNAVFPINVIATMSSGKSTLINALLRKRMMPAQNEACTATITEILDNDSEVFAAVAYDQDNIVLQEVPELTYNIMAELNANPDVYRIAASGNIPFLDAKSTALMLVDTPGPNNSQNQVHKNITYRAINNDSNNLILYVLNGTQLRTNDDASLLSYVAEQIKKGGKQVRDRFLFVINKMDEFDPEEENIEETIEAARRYLADYGIEDPQIFPCSAYTALNIRKYFDGIDIDKLTRADERKLPQAAKDTIAKIYKFIDFDSMHLEQYSTLSPSAQRELDYKLSQAEKNGDTKEQALIHCGIYSIEAAITAYVKKYAKTKKIKDLVESFQEVLESTQVLAKAKMQVATDEEAAKACAERAASVKAKIADGEEAEVFKKRIAELDSTTTIKDKAEALQKEAIRKTSRIFEAYGDTITNKEEAKRLVRQFATMSSDSIAELTAEMESVINQELIETGNRLLAEYQEKLTRIDEGTTDRQLDFKTVDLIKGALSTMRENADVCCSDEFADETVEDIGETTYEEKVYYEKTGQEEEEVVDGTERVKIGTRKVKTGSHKVEIEPYGAWEKLKHFFGHREYRYVDDYKDEDVFETQLKFKTVIKDVFEERREQIEKFSVKVADIQTELIYKFRRNLDDGLDEIKRYAEVQGTQMKKQFTKLFDELDCLIQEKYTELEQCSSDQKTKEEELEKNKKLLSWIEVNKAEIERILDI